MTAHAADLVIRKSLLVKAPVEHAFRVFTERIATWWPVATHSLGGEGADVVLEQHAGGRLYERAQGGEEHDWAEVVVWEPPRRVVLAWHVNPRSPSTEVEVTFTAESGGTRLELEHRGWERYGEGAREAFGDYETGWDVVLAPYRREVGD